MQLIDCEVVADFLYLEADEADFRAWFVESDAVL